jgi:hypothetical protein
MIYKLKIQISLELIQACNRLDTLQFFNFLLLLMTSRKSFFFNVPRYVLSNFASTTNIWMCMLIVAPYFKSQCFQQISFSLGVWQEIMLGVYPIEVKQISFCLTSYDKLSPWYIFLMGGHTSYYGLLFLLTRKIK